MRTPPGLHEAADGEMSRQRVREASAWALGFSRNGGKGQAVKKLAVPLQAQSVGYKLSPVWEAKTGIPLLMPAAASRQPNDLLDER